MADVHGMPSKAHCPKCGSADSLVSSFVDEANELRMHVKCPSCKFYGDISAEDTRKHLEIITKALCEKFGVVPPI